MTHKKYQDEITFTLHTTTFTEKNIFASDKILTSMEIIFL